MAQRIEDYALIGDCYTAALVGRDGSIDWLCGPRFDSPACFAALLGAPEHGRWRIAPRGPAETRRRYRGDTMVLETEHACAEGVVRVIDFMSRRDRSADVVRIVEGVSGDVAIDVELVIRFDYGSVKPALAASGDRVIALAGSDRVTVDASTPLVAEDGALRAALRVRAGERVSFRIAWSSAAEPEPPVLDAEAERLATEAWWAAWAARCTYQGPWRDAVVRSLLVLKALTFEPTGGIIAAPTTSLPEALGGTRNWDYRICWLRDATFTLYALMSGGYVEEARAWRRWLVAAVSGDPAATQIMYGVGGERNLVEIELRWLPGYEGSRPVRIGNDAHRQLQLDVYGEVMDAMHVARRMGLENDDEAWQLQVRMVAFVEGAWTEPDEGIWEVRGPRRHFTHSKVMAWVALDRAVKAVERFGLPGPVERWRQVRARIHDDVCARHFDPELGGFVQYPGAKHTDASLLMMPLVGFLPATDPRMLGTIDLVQRTLLRDGFVQRYPTDPAIDGLPAGEGAFFLCTFWLADALTMVGRRDEARALFERLLSLRSDLGLLAEQYEPRLARMLGNFPQAFSHVGLVNTARNVTCFGGEAPAEHRKSG